MLYLSTGHRDLHSFPTRRSSDLIRVAGQPLFVVSTHLENRLGWLRGLFGDRARGRQAEALIQALRSEEHTSALQSLAYLVCRLLIENKNSNICNNYYTVSCMSNT